MIYCSIISKYCAVVFAGEEKTLHALFRLLLRLECMSHILAWSKTSPAKSTTLSVDTVELPRLRLTFEKKVLPDGTVRYMCVEQSGQFISAYTSELKIKNALHALPNTILLSNEDNEYSVVIPSTIKPTLVKSKISRYTYKMVPTMTDIEWLSHIGEATYFLYPIHSSGTFMLSRSIGSSLYLLVIRLMTRKYKEAFSIIESCVCDRNLTPQEKQIYKLIGEIKDDLHIDAIACRLKLFFVTYGCSDIMPYPFNVEEDISLYVKYYCMVSVHCRISIDEEIFIMSLVPERSKYRTPMFKNREHIIKACFTLSFDKLHAKPSSRTFQPEYPDPLPMEPYNPEPIDLELLDIDKPTFKNIIQKLSYVKYSRPEPVTGPEAITFLEKIFETQKNMGFFVLYDFMTNALPLCIVPDHEKPHCVGSVLFRVLPDSFITGLQRVILSVMEVNAEAATKMPIFEDKRKLKLPSLAGMDIFQSHVKLVCQHIKTNKGDFNLTDLVVRIPAPYHPPHVMDAAPTADDNMGFQFGRSWLSPKITDFTCERRMVSHGLIPTHMRDFVKQYTPQEIANLTSTPLNAIGLSRYIEFKSLHERGEAVVSTESPLR